MNLRTVYLNMRELATVLGWSTDRTRRFLKSHKAATKIGGRYYLSRDSFRDAFPAAYDAYLAMVAAHGYTDGYDEDEGQET